MKRNTENGPGRGRRWRLWVLAAVVVVAVVVVAVVAVAVVAVAVVAVAVVVVALGAALAIGYERVLRAAAVVVPGGGEDFRPHAAARLWREVWAPVRRRGGRVRGGC